MGLGKASGGTISIGDMKTTAAFQINTPTADGSGGWTEHYSTVYSCRGRFRQMSGNRGDEFGQLVRNKKFEFVCRYSTELAGYIADGMQAVIKGTAYVIYDYELIDQVNHWYQFILTTSNG